MYSDRSPELSILVEKLRALQTLMHHERDLEKLKFYNREFDIVGEEPSLCPKKPHPLRLIECLIASDFKYLSAAASCPR